MALSAGVVFPSNLTVGLAAGTTVGLAAGSSVGITGTPAVNTVPYGFNSATINKSYAVKATASSLPATDFTTACKGAYVQFKSTVIGDVLNTRQDGQPSTGAVEEFTTTALGAISLESLLDVQKFSFSGTVGTFISVAYRY